jgi:hypothetical protein
MDIGKRCIYAKTGYFIPEIDYSSSLTPSFSRAVDRSFENTLAEFYGGWQFLRDGVP